MKRTVVGELAQDSSGTFVRNIGYKPDGQGKYKHCRFYLGRDQASACIRVLRLEAVWEAVCKRWQRDRLTPRAVWDVDTLRIGQAVARGENRVELDHTEGMSADSAAYVNMPGMEQVAATYLLQMRRDFPMITIDFADAEHQAKGLADLEAAAQEHEETARFIRATGRQTLHQALDAYADHIRKTVVSADGRVSPCGTVWLRQVAQLKAHHPDMPLAQLNLTTLDDMLNLWKTRPISKKTKKPMAPNTVRDCIKRIRHFVRWLHRSPDFDWRKPADYEINLIRIPVSEEEESERLTPNQVATFTVEQLGILWEYASPMQRVWILLSLNCGFGTAEVGGLQCREVRLNQKHPYYELDGSFIMRKRFKTRVYGDWQLWPQTVAALTWYQARRPASKLGALLLTARGRPLTAQTMKGNNRGQTIPNSWRLLMGRIAKDHKNFPTLSYNKLRKTAASLVRQVADGETAGIFLCHGTPVKSDTLLDLYANRDFTKVYAAQQKVAELLAPVFARVAVPFPPDAKRQNMRLSLATKKRARELRQQGYTYNKIAELTGVSQPTARRFCIQE